MRGALLGLLGAMAACAATGGERMTTIDPAAALYRLPEAGVQTRWYSFENPDGARGAGGQANRGAKGRAFEALAPGETKVLADVDGSGTVRRIWMTLSDRSPRMLRALRLDITWDGADSPAVSAPVGDFFGAILGRMVPFEGALFTNPEGRSLVAQIPMPFRRGARITVTNEGDAALEQLFYDVAVTVGDPHGADTGYLHAFWHRVARTELGVDFELLPRVEGRGRFLGVHVGVILPKQGASWWGEGEVKAYVDGDDAWPTLVGTGTEDYVGTAYGQGPFSHRYAGALVDDGRADRAERQQGFYRYHIPDPIWFHTACRVTLQQMGGATKAAVLELLDQGVPVKPVSVGTIGLMDTDPPRDLRDPTLPDEWTNIYERMDVSAVAFFTLDRPTSGLPALQPVAERVRGVIDPAAANPASP